MKRNKLFFATAFLSCIAATSAFADQSCTATIHQKGTNNYFGSTTCHHVALKNLNVRGDLTITDSNIIGLTNVSGPITADNTTFSDLQITNSYSAESIMWLNNGTLVTGPIVFKGRPGLVCVDATSMYLENIVNGRRGSDSLCANAPKGQ